MSNPATVAAQSLKTIGNEITVWENRLEFAKTEVEKNTRTRDALQAEIDKKTADFAAYISQRDAENKKMHTDILADRDKLNADKAEFQDILKQHQQEKASLAEEKRDFESQKLKHAGTIDNVQQFITAVKRASGLLGI